MTYERSFTTVSQKNSEAVSSGLARQLVLPGGADELGNLGIGVQAGERVAWCGRRVENRMVVEPCGELQVLVFAGPGVEVGQCLVHAAVLGAQHRLHLGVAKAVGSGVDPVGELLATSRAWRSPQYSFMSSSPAKILCNVY